jgi:hypothetical protein
MTKTFSFTDYECLRIVEAIHTMAKLVASAGQTQMAHAVNSSTKPFLDQLAAYESERGGQPNATRADCSFSVPDVTVQALIWAITEYLELETEKSHLPPELKQRRISALIQAHGKLLHASWFS